MNKIYYHSNEFFLLRDYPEQPREADYRRHRSPGFNDFITADSNYHKALKACIAAKVRIDNPELLFWKSPEERWYTKPKLIIIKDGDMFDEPSNVEFESGWKNDCRDVHGDCQLTGDEYRRGCQHRCKKEYQVLHIKLKEEVKEENQDELLGEIMFNNSLALLDTIQERDARIASLESSLLDVVEKSCAKVAELEESITHWENAYHNSTDRERANEKQINNLESENDHLKSELDKAKCLMAESIDCFWGLRNPIRDKFKDFIRDKR